MATKDQCLRDKSDNIYGKLLNDQYSNINLNQNYQSLHADKVQSKSALKNIKATKKYDRTDSNDLQAKRESSFWNKSNKHLSSNYLNLNQESEEKQEFKYAKNLNNSTLSLHIAAYENSSEVDSDNSNSGENEGLKSKREGKHLIKKWSFSNEIYTGSSSLITNPFEFPRQKQEDESNPPEVMQFQASQQLRNPNEETLNNPVPASVAQPNPPLEQQQPDDREIGDEKSTALETSNMFKKNSEKAPSGEDDLVKIKQLSSNEIPFPCKLCPVDHGNRPCPKADKESSFEFDFNKLLPILQERFMDVATVYEKSKLQQVNKAFNQLLKPEKFNVIRELIAHANSYYPFDNRFWDVNGTTTHIHPEHEPHLEALKDAVINKKFNGVALPDRWITKLLNQNTSFYLTMLHISDSNLTGMEFKALAGYGTLEYIYIQNVTVEPPPKAYELAIWSPNMKKFHVHIKNFVCEKDWAKSFAKFSDKRTIRLFDFANLSPAFNANDFDKFIRTRVVSTKEQSTKEKSAKEKEREKDVCVRISFADKFFKNMTRKSVEAKIDRAFAGVFKRVPKVQYELFSSTDKFIVNGDRGPEKSRKTYFYVNCRAIDALLKEAEELKISQGIRNLEI